MASDPSSKPSHRPSLSSSSHPSLSSAVVSPPPQPPSPLPHSTSHPSMRRPPTFRDRASPSPNVSPAPSPGGRRERGTLSPPGSSANASVFAAQQQQAQAQLKPRHAKRDLYSEVAGRGLRSPPPSSPNEATAGRSASFVEHDKRSGPFRARPKQEHDDDRPQEGRVSRHGSFLNGDSPRRQRPSVSAHAEAMSRRGSASGPFRVTPKQSLEEPAFDNMEAGSSQVFVPEGAGSDDEDAMVEFEPQPPRGRRQNSGYFAEQAAQLQPNGVEPSWFAAPPASIRTASSSRAMRTSPIQSRAGSPERDHTTSRARERAATASTRPILPSIPSQPRISSPSSPSPSTPRASELPPVPLPNDEEPTPQPGQKRLLPQHRPSLTQPQGDAGYTSFFDNPNFNEVEVPAREDGPSVPPSPSRWSWLWLRQRGTNRAADVEQATGDVPANDFDSLATPVGPNSNSSTLTSRTLAADNLTPAAALAAAWKQQSTRQLANGLPPMIQAKKHDPERQPLLGDSPGRSSSATLRPEADGTVARQPSIPRLTRQCFVSEFRCYGKYILAVAIPLGAGGLALAFWIAGTFWTDHRGTSDSGDG